MQLPRIQVRSVLVTVVIVGDGKGVGVGVGVGLGLGVGVGVGVDVGACVGVGVAHIPATVPFAGVPPTGTSLTRAVTKICASP